MYQVKFWIVNSPYKFLAKDLLFNEEIAKNLIKLQLLSLDELFTFLSFFCYTLELLILPL